MNEYTVQAGDTPMGIAERYTGSLGAVSELVNANKDRTPAMSQGHLTFHPSAFAIGDKLALPANWPAAPRSGVGVGVAPIGVGATSFPLVTGVFDVDRVAAEAACQGGWESPGNGGWPPEIQKQVENVAYSSSTPANKEFFFLYEDALYKVLKPAPGNGNITGICTNFDKSKLVAVPGTPPIILPGQPGGPGTNVGLKDSSMPAWAPWAIGAVAVAAALGLAYVLWSGQAPGQPRALPAHRYSTARRNPTKGRKRSRKTRRARRSRR